MSGDRAAPSTAPWVAERWDALATAYDREYADELREDSFERRLLDAFAARAHRGCPVVDLGCGPGHITKYLADAGLAAFGVDASERMLLAARRRARGLGFVRGDLTTLTWPRHTLGGALSWFSIIHMTRNQVIDLVARLAVGLRSGAPMLVGSHAGRGWSRSRDVLGEPVDLDIALFDEADLSAILAQRGFERLCSQTVGHGRGARAYVLAVAP